MDGADKKLDMDDPRSCLIDSGSIPSGEEASNSSDQPPLKRTGSSIFTNLFLVNSLSPTILHGLLNPILSFSNYFDSFLVIVFFLCSLLLPVF